MPEKLDIEKTLFKVIITMLAIHIIFQALSGLRDIPTYARQTQKTHPQQPPPPSESRPLLTGVENVASKNTFSHSTYGIFCMVY